MSPSIPLTNWEAVTNALETFGTRASIDDGEVYIDFGNAHVTIRKDGYISTGMPLHEFQYDDDPENVTLQVADEALHITINDVEYTFRQP